MFGYKEIGVDLGVDSIKISSAHKVNGVRSTVNKVDNFKVYKNTEEKYSKAYFAFLKACIDNYKKENKIKAVSINIALSVDNKDVKLNFIDVPYINKKTFNASMKYEVLSEYEDENSVSSWKLVSERKEDEDEVRVLVATINKKIVDNLAQFKTIFTKINRVVVQPVIFEGEVDTTEAILDLSHSSTRVMLYLDGKLAQIETINFGGSNIMDSIEKFITKNELPYSVQELIYDVEVYNPAIELISSDELLNSEPEIIMEDDESWYALDDTDDSLFSNKDEDPIAEVNNIGEDAVSKLPDINHESELFGESLLGDFLDDQESLSNKEWTKEEVLREISLEIDEDVVSVVENVKKVIRMFELENNSSISRIRCTGEFSEMNYLKEKLNSELELEVIPFEVIDIEDEKVKSTVTLAALSAISHNVKKDSLDFSKDIKANVDFSSILAMTLALTITAGVGAKVAGDNYHERLGEVQSIVSTQDVTLGKINQELSSIQSSIDNYRNFTSRMENLDAQKFWLSDGLYTIPELTPLTIAVENIQIENGEMILHGYSSDYSSIGFYARSLEELGEVKIESIVKLTENQIYTVTMNNPSLISDKYLANHYFKIKMTYNSTLLSH